MEVAINHRRCITGTRITVYDVYYYRVNGYKEEEIAEILRLSPEQVQVAVRYIEENKGEVIAVHQEIEERNARGNPPAILAKLEASRAKMQAWLKNRQPANDPGGNSAGNPGGQ